MRNITIRLAAVASALTLLVACQKSPPPAVRATTAPLFVNGGFEDGNLNGWTVDTNLVPGAGLTYPPTSIGNLNLVAGGVNHTSVKTGTTGTLIPSGLSASSTLRFPRYGTATAVVNENGASNNSNTLHQQMTTTNADVDPADNKVHVRFAIAPVLQNPGHPNEQQPYFWVQLTNVSRGGQVLFWTFNFANQAGVPWKTEGGVQYTDWQLFDISPGNAQLAVGDTVEIRVVASGCSQGGHWGAVYVDAFGPSVPGLQVSASAPQSANTGTQMTYTFNYKNGGTGAATNTTIVENLPTGVTFASLSAPGATCTAPAVGGTGAVTCNVGTLNPAASGSFTVTVNVTAGSPSTISNGNYNIYADGVSALIGPLVTTAVTAGVSYADLAATVTDGVAALGWGTSTTWTLVVDNNGPAGANGATVSAAVPANVTAMSWTCAASNGAACPAASGSGAISDTLATFPNGGRVTYTIDGTIASGSGSGSVVFQATVSPPGGVSDNASGNNTAVDTDSVGTLYTLTLEKAGTGQGSVVSSPAAISCGAGCANASADFLSGTSVVLTAAAAAGNTFDGWSGGGCTGAQATCTVPVSAATSVTATFTPIQWNVTGSATGTGTISCTSPVNNGATSTCTITPAAFHYLSALTDDGANVLGSVSGGQYAISNVTANHAVAATFSAITSATALAASLATPYYGEALTLTATVTGSPGALGTPTGTVSFFDGETALCGPVTLSGGTATCTVSTLAAGDHFLTATYGGDATFPSSGSATLPRTVNPTATTTSLAALPASVVYGTPITLTATLAVSGPGGGPPTGTVSFRDGATEIGTAATDGSGVATLVLPAALRAAGSHSYSAVFAGDGSYLGSSSAAAAVAITRATPTASPAVSGGGTSVYGQPVTVSVTVSGPGVAPGGPFTVYDGGTVVCTGTLDALGAGSCSSSSLGLGVHALTVAYGGDANHVAVTSGALSESVLRGTTSSDLTADRARAIVGQTVTLTATVAPDAPSVVMPTGTFTFRDSSTVVCADVPVNGSGVATCATSALPVGFHALSARYNGSTGYSPSTSFAYAVSIDQASTQSALAAAPGSPVFGQAVTLTATVSMVAPATGTPAGTVALTDNGAPISGCTAVDLAGGTASCTTSALAAGNHVLGVTYAGDASVAGSSGTTSLTVGAASTTTALASAPNPVLQGQAVTLTATVAAVAPGGGTPAGTVTFRDGATVVGSASLSGGQATLTTSALAAGTRSLTASYDGSASHLASTSTAVSQLVQPTTTVALAASASPSAYGQPVTLTVTVTSGAGTPTGTVTVRDGATAICGPLTLSGGGASCAVQTLAVGTHVLTAEYGGDVGFQPATSPAVTQLVVRGTSTSDVVADHAQAVFGQPVTLTARVSPDAPSVVQPTGTITFLDSASVVCANVPVDGTGHATCTTSALSVAVHALTARYNGDAGYSPSTSFAFAVRVDQASTQVALATAPASPVFGQPVTITLTVPPVAPGAGTPGGTVSVTADGSALSGCTGLTLAGATATCSVSTLAVGSHALAVSYTGDGNFLPSSGSGSVSIGRAATATAIATSGTPSTYGQAVTFTATVSAVAPGSGTPAGTVTFRDGSTVLGTGTLATGQATFTTSGLLAGAHSVTATYEGSGSFNGSASAPTAQQVDRRTPVLTAGASPASSTYGAPVVLSLEVAGFAQGVAPTGTVSFSEGATPLCTGTLSGAGVASCSHAAFRPGAHTVTASYPGDVNYVAGAATASVSVARATPSVAVTTSPAPSVFGQDVTVSVVVVGSLAAPTGQVTVSDGAATLCGPLTLTGGAASCHVASLAAGDHPLSASYGGDSNYDEATPGEAVHHVNRAQTAIALASSQDASVYGEALTLTATVTVDAPGAGQPSGTVDFLDGETLVGSAPVDPESGVATLSVPTSSPLAVGTHHLDASYAGDASFLGAATLLAVDHVVSQASALVAVSSSVSPSVFGQGVDFSVDVSAVLPGHGTPGGSVSVTIDGGTAFDVPLSAGHGAFTRADLAVGDHAVAVSYAGDASFLPATGSVTQTVARASTTVALAADAAESAFGQAVTLTATAAAVAPGAGTSTGTVTFSEGGATLGTATLGQDGRASLSVASLAVGVHTLTASYAGDDGFLGSSGSLDHTVLQAQTTTSLATSANPAAYGQAAVWTAAVAVAAPGAGTPTGTVTFRDGATVLGTASVGANGTAVLAAASLTSPLAVGAHDLTAAYSGDDSFAGSSGALTQTVVRGASAVTVTTSPSPSMYGQAVTVSVAVTAVAPASGVPSGTVTLADGATALGTVTLDGTGHGSLAAPRFTAGAHSLAATYSGDLRFLGSTGSATHTVQPGSAAVAVETSRPVSRRGRPIVFTARVTSPYATPGGTVTFKTGDTTLGSAALDENAVARITVRSLTKRATPWPITAEYGGADDFAAGTGTLAGGQTVENTPAVAGAGSALTFGLDASSVVTIHAAGAYDVAAASFEAWVKPGWSDAGAAPSAAPTVLSLESGGVARLALGVQPDRAAFTVAVAGASHAVAAPLDDGAWHHVALVTEPAAVRVYVDGALSGTIGAAPTGAGQDLVLGRGFAGQVDEVRVWSATRAAAALAADLRRPLRGDEADLAGYWRMDEGTGLELFDVSAGAHDGAVALAPGATQAFSASTAWRHRVVHEERAMEPADAGYDADDDALTLAISAAASHGTASVDAAAVRIGYLPAARFLGTDTFTFTVDDGSGPTPYELEAEVTRILVCQADADCGGGDVCVQSLCAGPTQLSAGSGSGGMGCSSGGGGAGGLALLALALLRLWPRRRTAAALAVALVSLTGTARAQTPAAFAVQTFEPAPAGDRFFAVPGARVDGHLTPSASLTGSWAAEPLVLRKDGVALEGGHLVHRQLWGFAGVALPVQDRYLVDASMPVALYQSGTQPFANVSQVSSTGAGDLRLGARAALPLSLPVGLAVAAEAWLPTGSRGAYASDGKARGEPKLIASCDLGPIACGGSVGFLIRPHQDLGYTTVGNAFTFTAAAGLRWGAWLFGPELYGRVQLTSPHDAPVEALAGAQWSRGAWTAGLGVGTAFDRAAGAAPERVVARVAWLPGVAMREEALAQAAAEKRAAEKAAAEKAAAEREAARLAAERAEAERLAAEKAGADQAAAAQLAAATADRDADGIPDVQDACPDQPGVASDDPAKRGCPEVKTVVVTKERLEILQPVLFEVNRDVLRSESEPVLKDVATVLAGHPDVRVVVEGHTDSQGNAAHNTELSAKRAAAVKAWLVDRGGVREDRLETRGYGPTKPIASNATSKGRAANRRVVFTIVQP
jgi:uncharacterized repeat protein (TIGR01451 family)